MGLNAPNLFQSKKEWIWFVVLALVLIGLQLLFYYHCYQTFISQERQILRATVIAQYPKNDYLVLKLQSKRLTFYTTTREDIKDLTNFEVDIMLFLKNHTITFRDYLSTFYAPSYILRAYTVKNKPLEFIRSQHSQTMSQEFFAAIFLAKPISAQLREVVANFGVSHLIALSGFHLGILAAILYFLLRPPYRFFQIRYFPYRYELVDLGFIVTVILGGYLYLTDFPPSLVRAYGMFVVGWLLLLFGVSVLTYGFLFFVVAILVVIDVRLLFSLSFFFSVCGVFYIYMVLDWLRNRNKIIATLGITLWVFIVMMPITHYFFDQTSYYQLLSPLLTIAFSFFYLLALGLHAIGLGGWLELPLPQNLPSWSYKTPTWFYYSYLALSLLAIHNRFKPFLLIVAVVFVFFLYLTPFL